MVSGLLLGMIFILSLSYYWSEEREIRQELRTEQERDLTNLAHIAEESFLANDDLLLVKYASLLPKWNPAMTSASVTNRAGRILANSRPDRIGHRGADAVPNAASLLALSQPVRIGSRDLGTATVTFSQQKLDDLLQQRLFGLRRRMAESAGTGLLLSLAGCFAMALSWTRPIRHLARGAEQVGEGKWDFDLGQTEERGDELGFLARSFQSMASRLRELDQMKEDFVSGVTHELRSPLGAIESYLNLIDHGRAKGLSESALTEHLNRIRVNTQRLTRFVNDLLDVAALERGKIQIQCQAIDVSIVAQDVLKLFEAKLQERKLTSDLECPADIPKALADPEKIQQVLINLVSNAIKFTPDGGHIEISIEHLAPRKSLRVCVTDSGIGLDLKDQLTIFNKFEQVQNARRQVQGPKGTGLGLSICRELIQKHGGELGVTSRLGQGSTFFFTLPAAEIPVAQALN